MLKEKFFQHKEEKGIKRDPDNMNAKFWKAFGYINGNTGEPNSTTKVAIATAKSDAESLIETVNALFEKQWVAYRAKVEEVKYSLFKDFERL